MAAAMAETQRILQPLISRPALKDKVRDAQRRIRGVRSMELCKDAADTSAAADAAASAADARRCSAAQVCDSQSACDARKFARCISSY